MGWLLHTWVPEKKRKDVDVEWNQTFIKTKKHRIYTCTNSHKHTHVTFESGLHGLQCERESRVHKIFHKALVAMCYWRKAALCATPFSENGRRSRRSNASRSYRRSSLYPAPSVRIYEVLYGQAPIIHSELRPAPIPQKTEIHSVKVIFRTFVKSNFCVSRVMR